MRARYILKPGRGGGIKERGTSDRQATDCRSAHVRYKTGKRAVTRARDRLADPAACLVYTQTQ